jgi:hypothetical protein
MYLKYSMCVFLDGRVHHFLHTAVVAQVNYLHTRSLDDPAHDVDGGIVPIEQAGGCYNAHFVFGLIGFRCLMAGQVGFAVPVGRQVRLFRGNGFRAHSVNVFNKTQKYGVTYGFANGG